MNHKRTRSRAVAFVSLLACALLLPVAALAEPDGPGQRAGEISRLIPAVKIMRGADFVSASEKTPIYWQDLINTLAGGRARMALDDGSVLNVGSDSNLRVLKHDAGAQQTELALGVGEMRTQAQKIAHAGGKFEVRTPVGVAGVVGTDFFVSFQKKAMSVIVFEGSVKLCNLKGDCVIILAGKMSTVCDCIPKGPTEPTEASEKKIAEAISATSVEPVLTAKEVKEGKGTKDVVIGTVTTAQGCIGDAKSVDGAAVRSGDLLTAKAESALDVCIGTLRLELQPGATTQIFTTTYGVIVELVHGSIIYRAGDVQKQNVTIVTSDVRISPVLCKTGTGIVTVDDPCHLTIQSQSGKLFLLAAADSHVVEDGETYRYLPDHYVVARRALSPDAKNYHQSHFHKSCKLGYPFVPGPVPGSGPNGGPSSSIPEPSSVLLLGTGLLGLLALKLKILKAQAAPNSY